MTEDRRTPTFTGEVLAAIQTALGRVHVGMPGRVLSYDATTQKATVKPILERQIDGEWFALPEITSVPVLFPCGGGFSLTWPLVEGDTVWLVFGETSLDEWLHGGGEQVRPVNQRRCDLGDAVAIPGVRPFADPLTTAKTDRISISYGSSAKVEISNTGKIRIEAGGKSLLDEFISCLDAINVPPPGASVPLVDPATGKLTVGIPPLMGAADYLTLLRNALDAMRL